MDMWYDMCNELCQASFLSLLLGQALQQGPNGASNISLAIIFDKSDLDTKSGIL